MSKAMKDLKDFEEQQNLMRLADAQVSFLRRYSEFIPEEEHSDGGRTRWRRDEFQRDLIYLIQLAYREAQVPLSKEITAILMLQNRPIILENPNAKR